MKKISGLCAACLATASIAFSPAIADPTVGGTTVLGPFVSPDNLDPDNTAPITINFSGTDLGWTYVHDGDLRVLLGDTHETQSGDPIDPNYRPLSGHTALTFDDAFGSLDLSAWSDPSLISPTNLPTVLLAQHPGTATAKALNIDNHWLDAFKTPVAGWSNGTNEYAIFLHSKPQGCLTNSNCTSNGADMTCDGGLAFWGEEYDDEQGFTGICTDGTFGCFNDTMRNAFGWPIIGSGFCSDTSSTMYSATNIGRILSSGFTLRVGVRSTTDERFYTNSKKWVTNKFMNVATTTVQDFRPANGAGSANQDYEVAGSSGAYRRVFLFGRTNFVGVAANGRPASLYFAYVDMPTGSTFNWTVNYFTGFSGGVPTFSTDEADAVPIDLDSTMSGFQDEQNDIVGQMSIRWVEHLDKWVMLYGGGMSTFPVLVFQTCGVVELFIGASQCDDVDVGNGAIRMRTADDPWGPWSPPQDVFYPGNPLASPPTGEYASGGILYHPDCSGTNCAPDYAHPNLDEDVDYGLLYGPNIIEPWIDEVGDDVDIIWNVSTWIPYHTVLFRTRIEAD
ncbi:MAG: hypothetical protein CMI63_03545 [Parvularcula sp.]|nr:hypothetical protein [Parvularcula sp.]